MSQPSSPSPLEAKSPFLVLDASAGSGKTYNLVQHILMNALRPSGMANGYQKVLAITFTNNAAEEMKARLLKQLLEFSQEEHPEKNEFFRPIWNALELAPKQLQKRANASAKHMLHNYSTLHVGTIDQFTHRLVRTFTKDLDLDDNFEVRLDLDAMISESLDALYSSLGEQPQLREALVHLVRDRMNRDKSHNPDYELKEEGKNSFNEDHWQYLERLPEPKRLLEIEGELKKEIARICEEGKALSDELKEKVKSDGLDKRITYFSDVKNQFIKNWGNLRIYPIETKSRVWTTRDKQGDTYWEEFKSRARDFEERNRGALKHLKSAAIKLQSLAATKALLTKFDELQKTQNTMPLSAFNKLISEELIKEPAAFIYARLGEKYWHFYIDEFQDTSVVQFQNLHPLIEHSLTKDENRNSALVVGDAKQSIYRWRGGKAEQFMALVDNVHPINVTDGHVQYIRETLRLDNNFRTHGAIVNFNNALFSAMSSELALEGHQQVYSQKRVHQNPIKDQDLGEVVVDILDAESAGDFKEAACEKTVERIAELLERGHRLSDIAILVRGNSEGRLIANHLTKAGYNVLSADSLVLGNSHEGRLLHAASRLYINPEDKEARFALAHALVRQGKFPEQDGFTIERNTTAFGISALVQHFPLAASILQPANSLFDFAVRTFDAFGYLDAPNAMVDASLDLIYEYQSREGSFASLPSWWGEESMKKNVEVPESTAAVKVMTIHKSKGLEFEHVLVPFDISYKTDNSAHWIPFPHHGELEHMPVTFNEEHRELFDEDHAQALETKSRFDWINMVYVALTRPVCGLHLFFKATAKPKDLLAAVCNQFECDPTAGQHKKGIPVIPEQPQDAENGPSDHIPHTAVGTLNLKLALTAPEAWEEGGTDAKKWGTALHRILQHPEKMRPQALNRLYRSGLFSTNLHDRASHILDHMEAAEELAQLKEEGTIVYTERSLINGDAALRPDLLIASEQNLMVIDYKTGQPKPQDEDQLQEYIELLQESFDNVSGKLLYI